VNTTSQEITRSSSPSKTVPILGSDSTVAKSSDSSNAERPSSKIPAEGELAGIDSAGGDYDAELSIGASFHGNLVSRHDGVEVSVVQKAGVLDEIGVKAGDFILAIDDHYVFTIQELHNELRAHQLDSRVAIRYRRRTLIYDTFIKIGPG
jgi:S1-C subfamily serine protease